MEKIMTENDLAKSIDEFEKRWISISEELKKEIVLPEYFSVIMDRHLEETRLYLQLTARFPSNATLSHKLAKAFAISISHLEKARVLSASKWKDKHPGLFASPLKFENINFGVTLGK
jgi:hypothetical protein